MMKQLTFLSLLLILAVRASGQSQRGNTYVAPWDVPALEEPYFFEPYFDTIYIHDTVYVSDADAFLKRYYKGKITLNELVKNQQILDSILRQLSAVSGKELYFNFFGNHRFPKALSRDIFIKDYALSENMQFTPRNSFNLPEDSAVLSADLLFRFKGTNRTNRFLTDSDAVVRAIYYMIQEITKLRGKIKAVNLYFPDFDFTKKRAMAQFVKSLRLVLDASADYSISSLKIKVFLHKQQDESIIGEDFLYSLSIKSNVILLNPTNVEDDYYVEADPFTPKDINDIGLFTRINSHFYLARFSNGDTTYYDGTIKQFSLNTVQKIALSDLPDNDWESYLWFLIGLVVLILLIIALYFLYPPFSYLLNENMGIVLASAIIFSIEFFMLAGVVFQNMCTEDESTSLDQNPTLLFLMPVLMVVVLPLIRQLTRNRKLP